MAIVDKKSLEEEACILRFCKIVLGWDYVQLLKESKKNSRNIGDGSAPGLRKVKDTYTDIDDYLATFEPLLFEEVKAQIVQGRDEEEVSEWKFAIVRECSETDGFSIPVVGYKAEEGESISQNDLLLLSKTKICSLSTIVREYIGLQSIGSLPFKDLILTATDSSPSPGEQSWKIPRPLMEFIETNHNESQLAAIHASLSRKAFVLIQEQEKHRLFLGFLVPFCMQLQQECTPVSFSCRGGLSEIKRGPYLPLQEKYVMWGQASPWLTGINPRDEIVPKDGDDGVFPTTGNELKPEIVTSSRKYRVRVLVCAPSNSALDEIVLRLLNTGVRDENDHAYNPKIVRIGLKPHHSVRAVSMDYLVEQKLSSMNSTSDKQKHGAAGRDRDSVRSSILSEAAIVFSTLSFSGSSLFSKLNSGFDVVIIDEAAQAVEPATLVPLANGCKQVFLVGDPVQLPATVISPIAEKFGYGMSLFKRFQRAGYPVQMLKTQYRMHPEIRSFPSKEFYDEALEDGPDVKDQTVRLWHDYRCFGPFCFFDIHEGKESQPSGSGSWVNVDEVEFVLLMYHKLVTRYPELKSSSRLAIISPYRHQVKLFRERFQDTFGVESDKVVDINTVDGFQGREKDVAIFSCVRASKDKGIGFVADFRRMNVGITRARASVLVVGSASTLKKDEHWNNLLESAEKRNCLLKVSKPYTAFFSDENLKSMVAKDQSMPEDAEGGMAVDNNAPIYSNLGDAEQGQAADENEYGDGDGDGDDDGGYGED
ncbi:probable helicase MAGATAMA 3 isoform X3 [Vitis vinifera]|uniref:probable helicase MAGATAMA 3 isoform X3 n=1 Tax=Vitis vinifera TaxID=29760 RepID=UPI0008FEEB3C|nr:probable helicase MAGATAMA 3 isoform X3 [Vitis vinifera]|eukprot:XP_019072957.1 PREDICTED: probable helicase MAGATAMA 3 isoform X3 [Vitis vinifera]